MAEPGREMWDNRLDNYSEWWAKMAVERLRWNHKIRRIFNEPPEENGYMDNFGEAKSKIKKIVIG